jgi:hypothetical protein
MRSERPLVLVADDERNAVLLLKRILNRTGLPLKAPPMGLRLWKGARSRPDRF